MTLVQRGRTSIGLTMPSYLFTAATIPTDYTFTLDHAAAAVAAAAPGPGGGGSGSGVSTPTFVTPILNGPPAAVFYNGMQCRKTVEMTVWGLSHQGFCMFI